MITSYARNLGVLYNYYHTLNAIFKSSVMDEDYFIVISLQIFIFVTVVLQLCITAEY